MPPGVAYGKYPEGYHHCFSQEEYWKSFTKYTLPIKIGVVQPNCQKYRHCCQFVSGHVVLSYHIQYKNRDWLSYVHIFQTYQFLLISLYYSFDHTRQSLDLFTQR